jgi:hypothetical protein
MYQRWRVVEETYALPFETSRDPSKAELDIFVRLKGRCHGLYLSRMSNMSLPTAGYVQDTRYYLESTGNCPYLSQLHCHTKATRMYREGFIGRC